jgi:hypothetical protein
MSHEQSHDSIGQATSRCSTALPVQKGKYIDQLTTFWTDVERMNGEPEVRGQLLLRYQGAVHRYLLRVLRDADAAGDVAQEFAMRFLSGAFHRATRGRGRFRDYVKAAVLHLIADHYRRLPAAGPLHDGVPEPAAPDDDRQFLESWRDQLLARAWDGLARLQRSSGRPYYAVLRFRSDHPGLDSSRMAEQLSIQFGHPVSAAWVRQVLFRARKRFGDLLLDDLVQSLEHPTEDELEQELIDLGLKAYCGEALSRWRERGGPSR